MFGDFNTGPNAPRKRSRVAQGIHIGKRGSIPNTHSMRIFGCSVRHSTFTRSVAMQTTPHPDRRVHNPNGAPALQDRPGFIPQRGSGPHPGHPATWACVIPQRRARIVVDLFRNAKFDPHLDHPAALDLGRPVPDTTPKPLGGEPKTKNRLGLQLFCD